MFASVGLVHQFVSGQNAKTIRHRWKILISQCQPKIGIISTGDELIAPGQALLPGKVYDSNTTMLKELLHRFGFTDIRSVIAADRYDHKTWFWFDKSIRFDDWFSDGCSYKSLHECMNEMTYNCTVTICTGGVSMGDKDFVKKVLLDLGMDLDIGRVNMKPG